MLTRSRVVLTILTAFLSGPFSAAAADQDSIGMCQSFGPMNFVIEGGTPVEVKAGHIVDDGVAPAYCELSGFVAPQVGFEVRLPVENWNGKFLQQGCSGMCGKLVLDAANDALSRGYATATTDMGHRAVSSRSGIWAYNDPSAKIDYWYRGTHVATLAAKHLVSEYYGRELERSLYRGCGTGGRAGLIEAQRYPDDFDGVVITGGSVLNFVRSNASIMWGIKANIDENGDQILNALDLELVHEAVLKKCATAGTNIVSNPLACMFDPESLSCAIGDNKTHGKCLTAEKISAIRKYYDGPSTSSGEQLYTGQSKGSELGWSRGFFGNPSVMGKYIIEHYRYLLYPDAPGPNFEIEQIDFDEPIETFAAVDEMSAADLVNYDGFKAKGGKLLVNYGWNESSMPGTYATQYFDRVEAVNGGVEATQDFFRLFMVPGKFSCGGGSPGGQDIDLLTAMENWLENGDAPDKLLATTYSNDGEETVRTRPLFPYPAYGDYSGEGDPSDAKNYIQIRP
jgi:hypothetical protein